MPIPGSRPPEPNGDDAVPVILIALAIAFALGVAGVFVSERPRHAELTAQIEAGR